jgi:hypothetical protein
VPAAGSQRFAAGAGLRRAVVAGALALVTTVLVVGCGSDSRPSQGRDQASKPSSQLATTPPGDARPPLRSDRRGHSEKRGAERASRLRPESRPAAAATSGSSGKRFDYDVERIVREATAKLGASDSSASSRSLRRELADRLEAALSGIPSGPSGPGGSEGPAASALRQLGIDP